MFDFEKIKEEYVDINTQLLHYLQSLDPQVYNELLNSINKGGREKEKLESYYEPLTNGQVYEHFSKRGIHKIELPEGSLAPVITRYRFKKTFREILSGRNESGGKPFIPFLREILTLFTVTSHSPSFHLRSVLFPTFVNYLGLGCMQSFYEQRPGKKSDDEKLMKGLLPHRTVIYPTLINDKNLYLKIPTDIVLAFNIQEDAIYQMGMVGYNTDTLFFFPKNSTFKDKIESIETINPNLITDENAAKDFGIYNIFLEKINLWYAPVELSLRAGSIYLRVPKPFLNKIEDEFILLDDPDWKPLNPAFVLSYDPLGNLMYSRILFAKETYHDNISFEAILSSNLPEEVDNYQTLDFKKLYQRVIIDLDDDH